MLAPGGGTRGITPAAQAELTRQRSQNISLPTRALGMALGAAETLVPAGQSPAQIAATNFRALGTAALNYIKYGVGGVVQPAFEQGKAIGTAAKAGDPHAQGAALATVATTAAGAAALYGRAVGALPPKVAAIDMKPSAKPLPDPLDVPTYQRVTAPVRQRFATDAEVRLHNLRQRYANHTAETILPKVNK